MPVWIKTRFPPQGGTGRGDKDSDTFYRKLSSENSNAHTGRKAPVFHATSTKENAVVYLGENRITTPSPATLPTEIKVGFPCPSVAGCSPALPALYDAGSRRQRIEFYRT